MPSSPESSSDSSVGSPHNQFDGQNGEAESALPGVVSGFVDSFTQTHKHALTTTQTQRQDEIFSLQSTQHV